MGAKLLSPSVVICTVHNIYDKYVPIQIYAYNIGNIYTRLHVCI
jgi:hypothetical protein